MIFIKGMFIQKNNYKIIPIQKWGCNLVGESSIKQGEAWFINCDKWKKYSKF